MKNLVITGDSLSYNRYGYDDTPRINPGALSSEKNSSRLHPDLNTAMSLNLMKTEFWDWVTALMILILFSAKEL